MAGVVDTCLLIAAFASRHQGLVTRNTADFGQIHPSLPLISP